MKVARFLIGVISLILTLVSLSAFTRPSPVQAVGCGGPYPPKPAKVWAKSGPMSGEVTLYWDEVAYADSYSVVYGQWSGKYAYGGLKVAGKDNHWYTVKALSPGAKYYFRLIANRDCTSSPQSNEVVAWAGGASMPVAVPESTVGPAQSYQTVPSQVSSWSGPAGKLQLKAKSGPAVGQVTLSWQNVDSADNYHLVYGTEHGKFQYGALNIGKSTWYTVKSLVPGKTYHLAIVPVMNNRALYTSDQVMVAAARPAVEVVQTSPQAVMQPPQYTPPIGAPEKTMVPPDNDSDVQGVYDDNVEPAVEDNAISPEGAGDDEAIIYPEDNPDRYVAPQTQENY